MRHLLLILTMALLSSHSFANDHASNSKDTISVTGHGEVSAEPDQVVVSLTVSATNKDVNIAKADADRKYKAVLAAAKKAEVAEKDIKLSSLNLYPEYRWQENSQVLIGTRVSRSLSLTVKEMDNIASLLQELVDGDVSNINSVQAGFRDRSELERKALAAAIADAKDKAAFLAKQFDKELGSAYNISEHQQHQPQFRAFSESMMQSKSMAADAPQEQFGELKVTARISVVFHAR